MLKDCDRTFEICNMILKEYEVDFRNLKLENLKLEILILFYPS